MTRAQAAELVLYAGDGPDVWTAVAQSTRALSEATYDAIEREARAKVTRHEDARSERVARRRPGITTRSSQARLERKTKQLRENAIAQAQERKADAIEGLDSATPRERKDASAARRRAMRAKVKTLLRGNRDRRRKARRKG